MPATRFRLVLLSSDASVFEALASSWEEASGAPVELEWCTDVDTALQRVESPSPEPPLFVVAQPELHDPQDLELWRERVRLREGRLGLLGVEEPSAPSPEPPPTRPGNWRWDLETNAFDLAGEWCHWLGLDPSEGSGAVADFFARMHPADAEGLREMVTDLLSMDSRSFRGRVRLSPEGGPWWGAELDVHVVSDGRSGLQALQGSIRALDPRHAPSRWSRDPGASPNGNGRRRTERIREMLTCVLEREERLRPGSRRMLQDALQLADSLSLLHGRSSSGDDDVHPRV